MYRKSRSVRGLSVIEMILVVALMALLGYVSLGAYHGLSFQTEVDAAAHSYAQSLRKAHALARSMNSDTSWGVRVENDRIIVFQGTSYASRAQAQDEITPLEGALTVGGVQEVTFAKFSGAPSVVGTTSFTSGNNDIRLVDITKWGVAMVRTGTIALPPEEPPSPAPVLTFTAEPTSTPYNGQTTLTWSSTDAVSCFAGDAWSGTKSLSGTETISNLVVSLTFTLSCTGPGGSDSRSILVLVAAPPAPTCAFSANPTTITAGADTTLSWSSTDASTASITPGVGTVSTSGSMSVAPQTDTTYELTVSGAGGSATCVSSVVVSAPPPQNQPPVALNDSYSITLPRRNPPHQATLPVLVNDSDPDGDTLTIQSVSTPTNGATATIVGTSIVLSNIENGTTTFSYTISDGQGGTATATVTYTRTRQ